MFLGRDTLLEADKTRMTSRSTVTTRTNQGTAQPPPLTSPQQRQQELDDQKARETFERELAERLRREQEAERERSGENLIPGKYSVGFWQITVDRPANLRRVAASLYSESGITVNGYVSLRPIRLFLSCLGSTAIAGIYPATVFPGSNTNSIIKLGDEIIQSGQKWENGEGGTLVFSPQEAKWLLGQPNTEAQLTLGYDDFRLGRIRHKFNIWGTETLRKFLYCFADK
jgi:hypothetical protein